MFCADDHAVSLINFPCVCVVSADLCSSFLNHFQLALVDLDAPEETIKEPQEDPPCQPEQKEKCEKQSINA